MNLNIRVKMNSANKIIKDHGLDENGFVVAHLRGIVDRFCDPYIPFMNGKLSTQKTYPNNHSIKYIVPYAHYMYKGKKAVGPSKPKGIKRTISGVSLKYQGSPRRGAEWEKRMMNDRGKEVCRDLQNFIKRGGK